MDEVSGYDVIGDVHGCGRLLRRLLDQLGYRRHPARGHWWHPSGRRAVFAGDVIDRGSEQRLAVDTVRAMVDHGSAHLVLGNHELDLIAAVVTEPSAPSSVAPFSGERASQSTVLNDDGFSAADRHDLVSWLRRMPMWLDLGGLRVAHACWSDHHVGVLAAHGGPTAESDHTVHALADPHSPVAMAARVLVEGPHVTQAPTVAPNRRRRTRLAWWADPPLLIERRVPDDPGSPASADLLDGITLDHPGAAHARGPLIVGHYAFDGDPVLLSPTVACVDYAAVRTGQLVAYRWSGERHLRRANFACAS